MNRRLQACLVSLMVGAISGAVFAQSGGNVPLQRGVSVQLAVTSNAVAIPNADKQDALVVALTADGTIYLRGEPLPTPALADRVRSILSTRKDKTLYIKADARVPYARLVEVDRCAAEIGRQRFDLPDGTTGCGGPGENARVAERTGTAGPLTRNAECTNARMHKCTNAGMHALHLCIPAFLHSCINER